MTQVFDPEHSRIAFFLLVLVVLTYPWHRYLEFGQVAYNVSLADLVIVATYVVLGREALNSAHKSHRLVILLSASAMVLSLLVQALFGNTWLNFGAALQATVALGVAVLWALGIAGLVRRAGGNGVKVLTNGMLSVACVIAAYAIYEAVGGVRRPTGPFENPNLLGNYFLLGLASIQYQWMTTPDRRRLLHGTAAVVLGAGIVATGSRGAAVGFIIIFAWWLIIGIRAVNSRRKTLSMLAVGLTLSAGILTEIIFAGTVESTLGGIAGYDRIAERLFVDWERIDLGGRAPRWLHAWEAFGQNPLTGIGWGQFPTHMGAFGPMAPTGPHNTYLLYLTELGLLGVAVVGAGAYVLCRALRSAYSVDRPLAYAAAGFFAGTCGQALFTDVHNFRSVWLVAGVLLGIGGAASAFAGSRR